MEVEDILKRWTEYIKELYEDEQEVIHLELDEQGPEIMKEEIRAAVNKMKKGKAIGKNGIAVEMMEALGEKGLEIIKDIANKIYFAGILPEQMIETVMIPIPKVAGTRKCEQHRTISIINHTAKIILRVIIERMRSKIRPEISEEQFGFVKNSGTINAIFVLNRLIENALEIGKDVYLCFIDSEKAFDKVRNVELMRILKNIGIDGKDLRLIETLYRKQRVAVRIEDKLTEWTKIKRGVRQGCCMSPDFLNLYAEVIIREIKEEDGIKIAGKNINNIRYADDTVLIADSEEKLQTLLQRVNNESELKGIKINIKKTKVMVVSKRDHNQRMDIKLSNKDIEQVKEFAYLGSNISFDGRNDKEIRRRIAIANQSLEKIKKLITNSKISIDIRKRFVKCYVWSTLLYGCELWNINKESRRKLEAMKMRIWRGMLKVSWTQRVTNEEIMRRVKTKRELMTSICKRQLKFVGHIERKGGLNQYV